MLNLNYTTKNISFTKEQDEIKICISILGKEIYIHIEDQIKGLSALFG